MSLNKELSNKFLNIRFSCQQVHDAYFNNILRSLLS